MGRTRLLIPWLTVLALQASVVEADPGQFRGPFLTDVSADAITVLWESPQPTTGTIHYGIHGPNEYSETVSVPSIHHEVRLVGLSGIAAPGSRFAYELEVDGRAYPGSFYTALEGRQPFRFLVYGDNRTNEPQHEAVVDAMVRELPNIRFAVSSGDMVDRGDREADWDRYFAIEAPFLAHAPIYLALGNHEVRFGDWDIARRVFAPPTNIAPASNSESFYHFIYANVEVIVINKEVDDLYTGLLSVLQGDQEEWLESVLDTRPPGVDHRIVVIHKGPYSSKQGRPGNYWLRQWLDRFRNAGINIVISGHDHYAERGFAHNGLQYVIHGGGGAPLYDTLGPRVIDDHTIVYSETRLGYLVLSVDGPRLELEMKGQSGNVVDRIVYGDQQSPECLAPTDCGAPPMFACPNGGWDCNNGACEYQCDPGLESMVFCFSDAQCEPFLARECPGHAVCKRAEGSLLRRYCQCEVPPECATNQDCADRPPPIEDCEGDWLCADALCEFSPVAPCEEPEPQTDAGVMDATSGGADAAMSAADSGVGGQVDASTSARPDRLGEPPATNDAGAAVIADAGVLASTAEQNASGCHASGGVVSFWSLLGFAAIKRRRRRRRS